MTSTPIIAVANVPRHKNHAARGAGFTFDREKTQWTRTVKPAELDDFVKKCRAYGLTFYVESPPGTNFILGISANYRQSVNKLVQDRGWVRTAGYYKIRVYNAFVEDEQKTIGNDWREVLDYSETIPQAASNSGSSIAMLSLLVMIISTIVLLVILALPGFTQSARLQQTATVCRVIDGDTLDVSATGNCKTTTRVRLFGIDAPEKSQPLGSESRQWLSELVLNKRVTLLCNGKTYKRDVCRVITSIESDGGGNPAAPRQIDVAMMMVYAGLAYDNPKYSYGMYGYLEDAARQKKYGVWALPGGGVRPWLYRKGVHKQ